MNIDINLDDLVKVESKFVSPILGYNLILKFKNKDRLVFRSEDVTAIKDLKYEVDQLFEKMGGE